MPNELYRVRSRDANQALIRRMIQPAGPAAMIEVCTELLRDFQPSLFAEIDWQELRPDLAQPDLRQILGFIDDFTFFGAILPNILAREPAGIDSGFDGGDIERLAVAMGAYQRGWLGPDRAALTAAMDQAVASLRCEWWRHQEDAIRHEAEAALGKALAALTDIRRLGDVLDRILGNARYRYLDLPWTRRRAKASFRAELAESDGWQLVTLDQAERHDPARLAAQFRARAAVAERAGHGGWAALLHSTATAVEQLDPAALQGDEGSRIPGRTPCARCAMWFAFDTVSLIDTHCSDIRWSDRGIVFIPAGIGTAQCPFCGMTAPVDVPMLFYADQRGQIVYLAPTKRVMSPDEAIELWRPTFEQMRAGYLARLDDAARERFEDAGELVVHDIKQFLYAIQMGETIPEDHVYNIVRLADGSGLIFDGEKRFARVATPGEVERLTATDRTEISAGDTPAAAYDALDRLLPAGGDHAGEIETLLGHMIDSNDAIDGVFAEARRRRG